MNDNIGYTTEMIGGMPVVVAPTEIDMATADDLGTALLAATANGHTVIVVDMTGTRFCDSAGLRVLTAAHRRAVADGGELRLITPAGSSVFHVLTLTGMYRLIPTFGNLEEALIEGLPL